MHGSQEALGMLSPMDGAADKLLKGDLSGAVKEAAMEAGGGRVFKAAGKGLAAVKRHAGKLDEAVGALSHADDAATATATGVRESIEEASSVLAKEGGGAVKTAPNRIYSARELIRRADEPGPMHNFPEAFNSEIFAGTRTVVSPNYVLYTKPGTINVPGSPIYGPGSVQIGGQRVKPISGYTPNRTVEGVYEIGVRPSASGRTEVITHRFFRPNE